MPNAVWPLRGRLAVEKPASSCGKWRPNGLRWRHGLRRGGRPAELDGSAGTAEPDRDAVARLMGFAVRLCQDAGSRAATQPASYPTSPRLRANHGRGFSFELAQ
jgi:hypothetical protein